MTDSVRTAVIVPCLNEAESVAAVIERFRAVAPDAGITVVDNGSTDATADVARATGATVIVEARRGKGRALRTAFGQVDADLFVLADGDGQAPADRLPALTQPITDGRADMVIGSRTLGTDDESHAVNRLGNQVFSWLLRAFLGVPLTDVLSGYRAVRADAVRSLPLKSTSFEIEVELTIRAIRAGYRVAEVPISVQARHAGNRPRLRVVRDGLQILAAIGALAVNERPLQKLALPGLVLLGVAAMTAVVALGPSGGTVGLVAAAIAVLTGGPGLGLLAVGLILVPSARSLSREEELPELAPGHRS